MNRVILDRPLLADKSHQGAGVPRGNHNTDMSPYPPIVTSLKAGLKIARLQACQVWGAKVNFKLYPEGKVVADLEGAPGIDVVLL